MKRFNLLTLIMVASLSAATANADSLIDSGTLVTISLKNQDLPSNDLVYNGKVITPQQAQELKTKQHVDLSTLQPDPHSDIYKAQSTANDEQLDQALAIGAKENALYQGVLQTNTGFFRINVRAASQQTFTVMMGRTLHTLLLRKELMRRLGYKIPAMKYLSALNLHFPDQATLADVLKTQVPSQTQASSERWCTISTAAAKADSKIPCNVSKSITDPLEVQLQDIVATEATPLIYNLAIGAPIDPNTNNLQPSGGRLLRAASVPFGLVNAPESLNQFAWYAATVDQQAVEFTVPDAAYFNCTLDDARWILKRIAPLTRQDYVNIVAGAELPTPVAKLLVEKLISRRNSLMKVFKAKIADIAYSDSVSSGSTMKDGKILQQDWPGYASRFAWGDPDSPLKNIAHYFYSVVESNILSNLVSEFNSKLPALRAADAVSRHVSDLETQAIAGYMQTGKVQAVKFGVWLAPVLGGGVDISRSVIVGSYMGTNNMIQLADTYGYYVNAGIYIGVDGLPSNIGAQGQISGAVELTYTHLKPITDLKQATSQPIENIYVPGLLKQTSGIFSDVAQMQAQQVAATPGVPNPAQDKLTAQISAELDQLKNFIDVGESLIITQSITGNEGISGTIVDLQTPVAPALTLGIDANQLIIGRLHIYRKDANTIQVFKDQGELAGFTLNAVGSVGFPYSLPVITISASAVMGSAKTAVYSVNIDPDTNTNPDLFSNMVALKQVVGQESTEVLDSVQKPTNISVDFTDLDSSVRFFVWVDRTLKTNGKVSIDMPDGAHGNYVSLSDGNQTGTDYQDLITDVFGFILQRLTKSTTVSITSNSSPNPGQSLYGNSNTRAASYQARTDHGIQQPFVQVKYRWEGWEMQTADAIALAQQLGAEYHYSLFPKDFLKDTQKIQLYDISVSLNFYEAAIKKVVNMTAAQQAALTSGIFPLANCVPPLQDKPLDVTACWSTATFNSAMDAYRAGIKDPVAKSQAIFTIMSALEQMVDFPTLIKVVGGASNLYLSSEIQGFRVGSETLSDPIFSNALGKADPVTPDGPMSYAEKTIGINDGEFDFQWLREIL